jgi:periplasmic divalent cation tolerance protein
MDSEKSSYIVVFVTAPADRAPDLARALVEEELAACANIIPGIRSIYRWEGDICDDAEALMVIKTRRTLFEALRDRVVSLHPYDVPEVVALPLVQGYEPYLQWLEASTRQPSK